MRKLLKWLAALVVLTILSVTAWTLLWPLTPPQDAPEAEAILCLGGGMDRDGTLHAAAARRARTCAALYIAGKAPVIVMSSAGFRGVPSGAAAMSEVALAEGLPAEAILLEERARSTLQNMLFSRQVVPQAGAVIVVTEAFHLPRSWASARWAGFGPVHLIASERNGADPGLPKVRMILREAAAIWFNLGRAGVYALAGKAGVPEVDRLHWLD